MGLFDKEDMDKINSVAKKSKHINKQPEVQMRSKRMTTELDDMSKTVMDYFKDSDAILISDKQALHEYVNFCIESGYCGIDTETTGLDRSYDTLVGASLYTSGHPECYIPSKHIVPLFETPYKNQLSYEEIGEEFQRLVDNKVKLIFANADFDIAMIYKDLHVDMVDSCYFDVLIAARCLKEDEPKGDLKSLYNKYVLKGTADPKKFSDFFSPALFPYCNPDVAKFYAANDAKITYELFRWQLPYLTKTNKKCIKRNLQAIADLVWNVEFPLIKVCALIHRTGMYIDNRTASSLHVKYNARMDKAKQELADMVQDIIDEYGMPGGKKAAFRSGSEFNCESPVQVKYLLYDIMKLPNDGSSGTGKEVLKEINIPVTNKILEVRSLGVLINTFVDKLPNATTSDSRIHGSIRQIGADTGRMSCIAAGTKISVVNGYKNIEDIQSEDLIYCYDENTAQLHISKVKKLMYKGKKNCVDIKWQSSGKGTIGHLICTPDHKLLKKSGEWVEAKDLIRYDKVAHLFRSPGRTSDNRPEFYGWNNYYVREQDIIKYEIFGVPEKNSYDYVIHHIDEDHSNNDLSNFEILSGSYHTQKHSKELQQRGVLHNSHYYGSEGKLHYGKDNGNYRNVSRDELLQLIKDCSGKLSNINMDYSTFKEKCKFLDVDYVEEARKYNPDKYNNRPTLSEFRQAYQKYRGDESKICNNFNMKHYNFNCYVKDCGIVTNHIIQSVTDAGLHDVYDIEVEDYHNFIANELCVHNCADPNLQNIPSHASDIRHMFRGTSAKYDILNCKIEDDNHISFKLSKYDSVYRYYDDSFLLDEVKNLEIGDYVKVTSGKSEESMFEIKNMVSVKSSCNIELIFEVSDTTIKYRIPVKTSSYVMLSCDYSKQEPAITALISNDKNMQQAFIDGKDIYSMIASIAFNKPYEDCLEFHPVTHEYQKDGKARRGEAKTIVLGICYGRSVVTIGEQLYGNDDSLSTEEKTKKAQHVYDEVLKDFPNLKKLMDSTQHQAATKGYVETILGRRRHIPDMMLKPFEFRALPGYVNPDIDPLDPSTFTDNSGIPDRIVKQLEDEFSHYRYYGQIVKRTKELRDENIQVINNRGKIQDASRRCVNSAVQGSAADMTKMAMLSLQNDEDWNNIGGRLLVPVHDELICEVPKEEWERGGEILSKNMLGAADFMPFPMSCDVDVTLRWSGLEYPCPYKKPYSLHTEDEDEIKWIQYHLCEMEYDLPVFKDKNGDAPRGDAVHGVNGIKSDEYESAILDYEKTYGVSNENFLDHIESNVEDGIVV